MKVKAVKNGVETELDSPSNNDVQNYYVPSNTFSFPEDEHADLQLHFIIANGARQNIPLRRPVTFAHKNNKIHIQVEFELFAIEKFSDWETVYKYRS